MVAGCTNARINKATGSRPIRCANPNCRVPVHTAFPCAECGEICILHGDFSEEARAKIKVYCGAICARIKQKGKPNA